MCPPMPTLFFGVQPRLALAAATRVLKQVLDTFRVGVAKQAVGNQLLERGIFFDRLPRAIGGVFGKEQLLEQFRLGRKALEVAERMKPLGRHHEYLFGLYFTHDRILPKVAIRWQSVQYTAPQAAPAGRRPDGQNGLKNQHRIAVAVEAIFLFDCQLVRAADQRIAPEGADQHQ